MRYYLAAVILLILLLSGCSFRKEKVLLEEFAKAKVYHQRLIKTEKLQFYDHNTTALLLTATYLGETERGEAFAVGIYREDEDAPKPGGEGLQIRLNGKPPLSIEPLSDEDMKNLPFVVKWMRHYRLTFPRTESKKLQMEIDLSDLGKKGSITFGKIPKYML